MVRCLPITATKATTNNITSIYATNLGTVTLTWSRSSLGILLLADLSLTPSADNNDNAITDHLRLFIRPYLKWKRKGSKHHQFTSATECHRVVELSWDFSLATFRGPEPTGEFFLSVSVDGETALVVGDRAEVSGKGAEMVSRRERVRFGGLGGELLYDTKGRFGGEELEVSILIDVEGEGMRFGVDGEVVLEVRRLCWKFRGVDEVGLKSGGRIIVAWDLHDWLFREGDALFVLRFERGEEVRGCFWKRDWSDSSSGSWSVEEMEETECCEEAEAWGSGEGGFTLLVYGQKS